MKVKKGTTRPPVLRIHNDELIVDSFAGGGGASTGISWALGRDPDIAINHNAEAIAMHKANHPSTKHYTCDVFEVDPLEACEMKRPWQPGDKYKVGLAWFSPDCFPAGTMVLTREGYRPIEEVGVGDEVLTHKRRWRKVTTTMRTMKPLVKLRGHGHPGLLVSPEHPFHARLRKNVWRTPGDASGWTRPRGYERTLEPEGWVPAGELGDGWYWSSPAEFPEELVPLIPLHKNRRDMTISEDLLWLAGLYVADGWTRLTHERAELVITCGMHEVEGLREKLSVWQRAGDRCGSDELAFHERETRTAYQFSTSHRGLVEWLREHFGHGAAEKKVPGWALGMPIELRRAFLDGYLTGDGHVLHGHGMPKTMASTVSKALAFGIKALAQSLGFSVTVSLNSNPNTIIEGRKVNARPAWSVHWREQLASDHAQTVREGGVIWSPIRERVDNVCEEAEVYNLSVEEDESYVVDGIVVHNCTFFSKARGTKPFRDRDPARKRRGLAGVVLKWAAAVRPRIIAMENVEEFQDWGPLVFDARRDGWVPDDFKCGFNFRRWVARLKNLGYQVEWREMRACDYGAPTTRKRLFILARCDGQPIVWPEATHGNEKELLPFRTAVECIDWTIPCPSIFMTKAEAKEWKKLTGNDVRRPLSPKTMRRIAAGIKKHVLESAKPFIVPVNHGVSPFDGDGLGRTRDVDQPMPTVTAAPRGEYAVVTPLISPVKTWGGGGNDAAPANRPMRTITTSKRGEFAVVAPVLIQTSWGEREGQRPRYLNIHEPVGTIMADGIKHSVVQVNLERADKVAAFLVKHFGGEHKDGKPKSGGGSSLHKPIDTVTSQDHNYLVTAHLTNFKGSMDDRQASSQSLEEPAPTVCAGGNHIAEVRAFLIKYYGTDQDPRLEEPMHTLTTKDRMALVTVMIEGQEYAIVDICMRMLEPKELFRAQGFPEDYIIDPEVEYEVKRGKSGVTVKIRKRLNKTSQVHMCGNAVSPYNAEALLVPNFVECEELEVEKIA